MHPNRPRKSQTERHKNWHGERGIIDGRQKSKEN